MNSDCTFTCEPQSVREARQFVLGTLEGLSEEAREMAIVLVSELATNSVQYAPEDFTVHVKRCDRSVRVEVSDDGLGVPLVRPPDVSAESGRGLRLVQSLSDSWGISYRTNGRTKTTWFSLQVRPA